MAPCRIPHAAQENCLHFPQHGLAVLALVFALNPCTQISQRGVKAAAMTAPDPEDPLKDNYGDMVMVQSQAISGRKWTPVSELGAAMKDQEVRCYARAWLCRVAWRGGGCGTAPKPRFAWSRCDACT